MRWPLGAFAAGLSAACTGSEPNLVATSDAGCNAEILEANLIADTMLLAVPNNTNPSIRHGKDDTIDVGLQSSSRVLLRFDLPQPVVEALSARAVEATLTVTLRASGGLCGEGCPAHATTFQLHAASNDWNEGSGTYTGASWHSRIGNDFTDQRPWQEPGAEGTSDRSELALATTALTQAQAKQAGPVPVTFSLEGNARTELMARLSGTQLSFILVPTAGGPLFLLSREGMPGTSRLTFTICR